MFLILHCTRPWCESTLEGVCPLLLEDLPLPPDVPGGMPDYRRSLVTSFFYKFYLTVLSRLGSEPLPQDLVSATRSVHGVYSCSVHHVPVSFT